MCDWFGLGGCWYLMLLWLLALVARCLRYFGLFVWVCCSGVVCFVIGYCGVCLLWVLIVGCLLCDFASCGLYGCVGFGASFGGGGG